MTKVGDKVRFLNATGGGVVTRIEGKLAYVDEDGFETPVLLKDIVVVDTDRFYGKDTPKSPAAVEKPEPAPSSAVSKELPAELVEQPLSVVETPEGERINLVLAFEAADLKRLNTTSYDAYLVNDSNYFLYFTYLTRSDDQSDWIVRYAGEIEPNIELHLGSVSRDMLSMMDNIAVQYVAFKRDKHFTVKQPQLIQRSLDTTKFFKLHCFQSNPYFEEPVIALQLVKNDMPQTPVDIKAALQRQNQPVPNKDARRQRQHHNVLQPKRPEVIEVDLHIHQLIDNLAGLSNTDMLQVQLREARRVLTENRRYKGQKIVLIHGKGEGVLRKALLDMLRRDFPACETQDASIREYGFGATQVTIH